MTPDVPADPTVAALRALAAGDRGGAVAALAAPDPGRPLLAEALRVRLDTADRGQVYEAPAAFEAFILGGGNVGLYRAVSAALADGYRTGPAATVLDIGCGNGHALLPALAQATGLVHTVTLVEPSAALLTTAVERVRREHPEIQVVARNQTLQQFLASDEASYDVVQSTFALHAVPTGERGDLLATLAGRAGRLQLAEFDHTRIPPGTDEHLAFLADSYERGLSEYIEDRDLVAQGFLMGVLAGQLEPGAPRFTWEQPAGDWQAQLQAAGFRAVVSTPLFDYWSSPAFLLTGVGGAAPRNPQTGRSSGVRS